MQRPTAHKRLVDWCQTNLATANQVLPLLRAQRQALDAEIARAEEYQRESTRFLAELGEPMDPQATLRR